MDAYLLMQYAVIAVLAGISVWVVIKKQFPGTLRRVRVAIAIRLMREGRPGWLRGLGRRIAPPANATGAGGCGGCSSCDSPPKR